MMADKWHFIVNPIAGGGGASKKIRKLKGLLKKSGLAFDLELTASKGHATHLVQEAIRCGRKKIAIGGGDGTFNEAVNGVMGLKQELIDTVQWCFLPMGTGNDWVRTTGIPLDPGNWPALLQSKKEKKIYLGHSSYQMKGGQQERLFMNVAGMGFDAYVAQKHLPKFEGWGKASYLLSLLSGMLQYKRPEVEITLESGSVKTSLYTVAIALGKFYGSGMQVAPEADPSKGEFEVVVIKDLNRLEVIKALPSLYNGKIVFHPKVEVHQCKKVSIESRQDVFLQADGELLGKNPVEVKMGPSIRVVLPQ